MINRSNLFFLALCAGVLIQCKKNDLDVETPIEIHLSEVVKLDASDELDFITDFHFMSDETIWIGTFNNGIYQVLRDQIVNHNAMNSLLPNNRINDIFIDYKNRVWIATDDGFAKYQNNAWEVYDVENTPLVTPRVLQIAVNKNDEIIIGNGNAEDDGLLFRSQNGIWKAYTTKNSRLPCSYILDIEVNQDDDFWISTGQFQGRGGIAKFKGQEITEVYDIEQSGLLYNWIDNIEVSDDYIWLGFMVPIYNESGIPEGGIQRLNLNNGEIESFFPNSAGEISNRVTAMKRHSDNSLWFTTILDDPECQRCYSGIGRLSVNNEFIIASSRNADITSNAYFPKLNEDFNGDMYVASDLTIYRIELKKNKI